MHFEARHAETARELLAHAEEAYADLARVFGGRPSAPVEVVLLDHEDTHNGLATPLPNLTIYVYLLPDRSDQHAGRDRHPLHTVLDHELTHIFHEETVGGLTAVANGWLGRALYPNLFQPFFLVEGLAVFHETRMGSGGRLRDGDFDMMIRTAALGDRLLPVDRASGFGSLSLWPGGISTYLYGSHFYTWLESRYGGETAVRLAREQGAWPWFGIDHVVGRVLPGETTGSLWHAFLEHLRMRARVQLARIERVPLVTGKPLTTGGYLNRHPVWTPDGQLMYLSFRPGQRAGLYRDRLDGRGPTFVAPRWSEGAFAVTGPRSAILAGTAWQQDLAAYDDLFRLDLETGQARPLTRLARVSDPSVAPDGRRIVAVIHDGPRSGLTLFDAAGHPLAVLVAPTPEARFGASAWSPDGRTLVLDVAQGGMRDLYLWAPGDEAPHPLWRDRAIECDPVFSPDGRWLYFSSDRSGGVYNVFAMDLRDHRLYQVTHVAGAAVEPAPSPDGRRLVFASLGGDGWNLHELPVEPASWRAVDPSRATTSDPLTGLEVPFAGGAAVDSLRWGPRGAAAGAPAHRQDSPAFWPPVATSSVAEGGRGLDDVLPGAAPSVATFSSDPYSPWETLRPKTWAPVIYTDPSGWMFGGTTLGTDVLTQHQLFLNAGWSPGTGKPYGLLTYQNDQLRPSWSVSCSDLPSLTGLRSGGRWHDVWQQATSGELAVTVPGLPSQILGVTWANGQSLTAGLQFLRLSNLGARRSGTRDPLSALPAPDDAPVFEGQRNSAYLTYRTSDTGRSSGAPGVDQGTALGLTLEHAGPTLGSSTRFDRISGEVRRYWPLPLDHWVLATRAAGGMAWGDAGGDFRVGGTASSGLLTFVDMRSVGGVAGAALRGVPAGSLVGDRMAVVAGEVRFPVLEIQRGLGAFPLFVSRVHGAAFAEWGAAGRGRLATSRLGLGLEARMGLNLLFVGSEWRLGWAVSPGGDRPAGEVYSQLGISY
jgi:hypothetical protein